MKRLPVFILVLLTIALSGCAALSPSPTPTPEPVMLEYVGHSCVRITAPDGTRVVSDPYQTYRAPQEIRKFPTGIEADVLTISHFHPDHANTTDIEGEPQVFYEPGTYQVGEVMIAGYESDHGLLDGSPLRGNTAFVFKIGDVTIVHMGAAGVITQQAILDAIQDADVILVDIRGNVTHPLEEMIEQMAQVSARTVIPTHYSLSEERRFNNAATVDEFLALLPADKPVVRVGTQLRVTPDMPSQVVVLTPLALETQ